ncbi:MAG: oligosaccharide flippase family protein [bacterium]
MTKLKKNIIANYAGNGWTALMSLLFIPLYIHFMGIESYGLVGLFAVLQAVFAILDMGLGVTMNREMARLSIQQNKSQEMRNLARTLELVYWLVGALVGITVIALAPFIAEHWLRANRLSPETMRAAIMTMGLVIAFRWPFTFYSGGLMGLQRQVLLNAVKIIIETLRGGGAALVLWLISPTIQAFFIWQIIIAVLGTFLAARILWRSLPQPEIRAGFEPELFRHIWRFAAGMSGIAVMSIILTQMDKIILSRLLTLEMFGYYSLASVAAMALFQVINPVVSALFPRFTQLVSLGDQEGLKQLYHRSCQLMSVLILPAAIVAALFSREILLLWTQNPTTVEHTHLILSILVIGTALNGLMNLPYALQVAHGWTRLAFYSNVVSVIVLVPLIFVMTSHYGAAGAAIVWVMLNSGYVLIGIQLMHRRLLPGEKWRWYAEDLCMPLFAALLTAGLGRFLLSGPMSQPAVLASLIVISIATLSMSALAAPYTRERVLGRILKYKAVYESGS